LKVPLSNEEPNQCNLIRATFGYDICSCILFYDEHVILFIKYLSHFFQFQNI